MGCLELSKEDIDIHTNNIKDFMNSLVINNISDMSDDGAAVLFINSLLDLFDTSSYPSMQKYLMKNAKDDISIMMPSLKKALANKVPLKNKLYVGGQIRPIFNAAYTLAMAGLMIRYILPVAEDVIVAGVRNGVNIQILVTFGAVAVTAVMAPFVLLNRHINDLIDEREFMEGPLANRFAGRPTLEAGRYIGHLNVKSAASLAQPHNVLTFNDFQDNDEIVLLERRRGKEVSRNATNVTWPFIFRRGAEGEGIEQLFLDRTKWPINPLSRRELQQANVERATLRIRPNAKEGLRGPGENSIPNNTAAPVAGLDQRQLRPRRGGRSTRRRKN